MAGLSDLDIVTVWSVAEPLHPAARGAALLRAFSPGDTLDELARLPIGRRDARLLALREQLFGSRLAAVTDCPACGLRVEAEIPIASLGVEPSEGSPRVVTIGEYRIEVRPPDTRDLLAIAGAPDEESARAMLLGRCIRGVEPEMLSDEIVSGVVAAIAACDPGADVTIALTCPECGHVWDSALDIGAFLWSDIDAAAQRALRDVDALATVYGWSEEQILTIPASRRQFYLAMVPA
jgi:hypothetical protein